MSCLFYTQFNRYNVGKDCPYYNDGYTTTTLDLQARMSHQRSTVKISLTHVQTPNGVEIEGPSNELYLKIPFVSNIILGR